MSDARERLQQTLTGYTKGRNQYVAVSGKDLFELASQGQENDPVVQSLRQGSEREQHRRLIVRVDDLLRLLEAGGGQEAEPRMQSQPSPPTGQQREEEPPPPAEKPPVERKGR